MNSDWTFVSFAELIDKNALEIGDGYRAKNTELGGDGLIFLRAGHVKDTHIDFHGVDRFLDPDDSGFGRKISQVGDVIITTKGNSTGRVAYVTAPMPRFVYSPHLSYWRSMNAKVVEQGFLRAWSQSAEFFAQLEALSRSTDMAPYLSLSDQRRLQITLPPRWTQKEIATLNDALHERITLLRETNATLEAIAQALFKSWFVDFDPVRAKMGGRVPEDMDDATAALFPANFEQSRYGLVPQSWSPLKLDKLAERVGMGPFGSNIKVSTFVDEGVPVLNGSNVQGALLEDGNFRYVTKEHAVKLKNSCVRAGDIVLTHRGTLGQVALVPIGSKFTEYVLSQSQFFLRCDTSVMQPEWMLYFLKSFNGQHLLLANASQVGVPSIARPSSYLRSITLIVPSIDLVNRFADVVRSAHIVTVANRTLIRTLENLRDTMLPRLISGQLRLPENTEVSSEEVCASCL